VVHNGTLENVEELREELKSLGITLVSQTDTEVREAFA
jgi:Glucosamine 6-phosphate synthetase, contains amidotransferase and phosphosugar isomerase domains